MLLSKDESTLRLVALSCQDFRAKDHKGNKIKHFRAKKGNYFVLDSVNLTGVDLTGVDLTGAKLKGADLTGANLTGADLTGADLTGANLVAADLTGADLTGVDLTGADLSGENLIEANLTGANLTDANLRGVRNLTYNQLASVKSLYETQGLEEVLGQEELTRLKAEMPELFEPPKEEQNET